MCLQYDNMIASKHNDFSPYTQMKYTISLDRYDAESYCVGKMVGLIWPFVCNMPTDLGPILKSKSGEKLLKSHHTIETLIAAVRVVKTFTVKNSLQ